MVRPGWAADLHLKVVAGPNGSVPSIRRHSGPLRLQKMLYPEGPEVMHAILIHPPGGVVGGDSLDTTIQIAPNAHCLVTTPGAAKWYRSELQASSQKIRLEIAEDASLEWLPQENIVFDGAITRWQTSVHIAPGASAIGMEVVMLGRKARGEKFAAGTLANQLNVYQKIAPLEKSANNQPSGERLLFCEQWELKGNDHRLTAMQGLSGAPCFGQLWALGSVERLQAARHQLHEMLALNEGAADSKSASISLGVTLIRDQMLLVRAQGVGPELVRSSLEQAWRAIRLPLLNRVCIPPRIWST
jgi:urease accessory protein